MASLFSVSSLLTKTENLMGRRKHTYVSRAPNPITLLLLQLLAITGYWSHHPPFLLCLSPRRLQMFIIQIETPRSQILFRNELFSRCAAKMGIWGGVAAVDAGGVAPREGCSTEGYGYHGGEAVISDEREYGGGASMKM
jgi:hypothetical protein